MILPNEVECDEAYVVAGHKGQPEVVKSKERKGRRRRLKGKRGRGTMEKERPPVFGMIERGGQVVINLLANVKQKTIEPLIKDTIDPGTVVYTDEYNIYARLQSWGYSHKVRDHRVATRDRRRSWRWASCALRAFSSGPRFLLPL